MIVGPQSPSGDTGEAVRNLQAGMLDMDASAHPVADALQGTLASRIVVERGDAARP